MYCDNCGAEIPKNAEFCPNCGQKVTVKKTNTVTKSESKTTTKPGSKKKLVVRLIMIMAVLLVGFFGYRLVYYPSMVKSAVTQNGFVNYGYSAKANVLSKKVVITATKAKVYNLVAASTGNGFSTHPIGAEEQLASLAKDLPGNWTVQIIQNVDDNSPRVMWEISGGQESVRYQNSNEFKNAKRAYIEASRRKDATNSEINSAVAGAAVGGLIGFVLGH